MFSNRWIQIQIHKKKLKKSVRKNIYPQLGEPPPTKKKGKTNKSKNMQQKIASS